MIRWRKRIRRMSYLITDMFCILISIGIAIHAYQILFNRRLALSSLEFIGLTMLLIIVYLTIFVVSYLYEVTMEGTSVFSLRVFARMSLSNCIAILLSGAFLFFLKVDLSRLFLIIFEGLFFTLSLGSKHILKILQINNLNSTCRSKNILVIGHSSKGEKYIGQIKRYGYLDFNIIGYVHIKMPEYYEGIKYLGGINQLENIMKNYVIDEIAVAKPLSYDERLKSILNRCQEMGTTITMLLDTHNYDSTKAQVAMVGNIPVLKFHTVSLNESQIVVKRVLDVFGAMVGMCLFIFAYPIVGLVIKLETPGPIIFKQKRVGKNGRIFEIWKFRSMGANAEMQKMELLASNEMTGCMFKMTDDPRVTRIGKFIRKTSIDELPQFWNVFKGDMSLVGTRPPTVDEVNRYEAHHHRRISITPGITGNWQISGRSDIEDFEEVVRLDTEYISNWNIWQDVKILIKTIYVVIKGKGSK